MAAIFICFSLRNIMFSIFMSLWLFQEGSLGAVGNEIVYFQFGGVGGDVIICKLVN